MFDHNPQCGRRVLLCVAGAVWMGLAPGQALAIAPPFVPDQELVTRPVIVVAKWDRAPLEPHNLVEGTVCKAMETRCRIIIERVIRGDVKAGMHTILLGAFIAWQEKGGCVVSYTSTMCLGEDLDVAKPNLWFLSRKRSWDPADDKEYLFLETYRGVQPLALEPYFRALGGSRPREAVPALLSAPQPVVVLRALEYVSGGEWPWPFDPHEFERFVRRTGQKPTLTPLPDQAAAVEKVLDRPEPRLRAFAATVYAALAGVKAMPRLRTLLADKEANVRCVAIGLLARQKDGESAVAINKAVAGIGEPGLACKAIEALAAWGSESIVPALIGVLQNDGFAFQVGDEFGIPALKTQAALKQITGYAFPFDVETSLAAWNRAKDVSAGAERLALLAKVLPFDPEPLEAALANAEEGKRSPMPERFRSAFGVGATKDDDLPVDVVVTNRSKQRVTITRLPAQISFRWAQCFADRGSPEPAAKEDFVDLAPGESIRFAARMDANLMTAVPQSRKVTLQYLCCGSKFGVKAWIGAVAAKFGGQWTEPPRVLEDVTEHWPNGNLKTRGQTLNGKKHGVWSYYREDGKKIREVTYVNGGVSKTVELNPNYVGPGQ